MGENKARFVMKNIEAMEVVVNVGLDGQLSPNTVTTSHMGRIYQWLLCPEGTCKGGPTKNMFKIRPRGRYPKQRFPYIPFVSRRFRHHKKKQVIKEATSEGTEFFFGDVVKSLQEMANKKGRTNKEKKSRSADINEWRMIKKRLKDKRQKLLTAKQDREDAFFYDISPSLSSSSPSSTERADGCKRKGESRVPNIERWSNLCKEIKERNADLRKFSNHSSSKSDVKRNVSARSLGGSFQENEQLHGKNQFGTSKQKDINLPTDSAALSFGKQPTSKVCDGKILSNRTKRSENIEHPKGKIDLVSLSPSNCDFPSKIERSRTSSAVRSHQMRSVRRLENSSSDLVTLGNIGSRSLRRSRKSASFLANLASRMNQLKQDVRDEPNCELNLRKDSLKSSGNLSRADVGCVDFSSRYLPKGFIKYPVTNSEFNRLFGDEKQMYRSFHNSVQSSTSAVGANSMLIEHDVNAQVSSSVRSSLLMVPLRREEGIQYATQKTCSLNNTRYPLLERPDLTNSGSLNCQGNRKRNICNHPPNVLTSPLGANISREKHFLKHLNEIYFPAQSVAGVLTRGSRNGRTVETFLFNPYWPSQDSKSQSKENRKSRYSKTHRAIPIKSLVEICMPSGETYKFKSLDFDSLPTDPHFSRGKVWKSLEKVDETPIDFKWANRQNPVIAKCFARIHLNKDVNIERKAAGYDNCADSPKCEPGVKRRGSSAHTETNQRNHLVFTERISIHSHRRRQRT